MKVCKPCRDANQSNAGGYYLLAAEEHSQCTGNCDCEHNVGRRA